MTRLAIVTSHPVQYQAPLFRELARRLDLRVLFAHRANAQDQAAAGFNVGFEWDVDLLSGYAHTFMPNVAQRPGLEVFSGCDTPSVATELAGFKPDAVLLMGWHLKCYWQSIWAAKRLRVPVIVRGDSHLETPRGLAKRAAKAVAYPIALRAFDRALYVGEQSRRYWEHYRFPRSRMFFSPHCVDNDWFAARATREARCELRSALGIRDDTYLALFAGKLETIKRVGDIVEAVAICRSGGLNIEVLIAGSGALEGAVKARALDRGVPLHLLGFCNQTRMPAVYATADVLVLASESETWGLVANEALACGKPIIVSDACGCAPDLAADGTAGRVFRCGNAGDLADSMKRMLELPPTMDAIKNMARRYSLGAAADGIVEAIEANCVVSGIAA